jgi:hypothetical protein
MTMSEHKPILDLAREITSGDRRRDYGRPLVNHLRIALMWSIQDERPVSPIDVAWKLITLKAAREIHTPKYDNLVDTIGYAACVDDMGLQAVELGMAGNVEDGIKFLKKASVGQMYELMLLAGEADELARNPATGTKALGEELQKHVVAMTSADTEAFKAAAQHEKDSYLEKTAKTMLADNVYRIHNSYLEQQTEQDISTLAKIMGDTREEHARSVAISYLSVDDLVAELERRGIRI